MQMMGHQASLQLCCYATHKTPDKAGNEKEKTKKWVCLTKSVLVHTFDLREKWESQEEEEGGESCGPGHSLSECRRCAVENFVRETPWALRNEWVS